jgi:long-subunit fatty acid transport protein
MPRGALWLLLPAVLLPLPASAGGILVGDIGTQTMSRGGAFVARADDPTALAVNPAGMLGISGTQVHIGVNILDYSLTFTRSGYYERTVAEPQPSYVYQPYPSVTDQAGAQVLPFVGGVQRRGRWAFGIGIWGPQSVPGRSFPCHEPAGSTGFTGCPIDDSGAPSPQRYDVVEQAAYIALPSIGVAYRVLPSLDVGVRLSWGFAHLNARSFLWGMANPEEDIEKDGDFKLDVFDAFIPAFGLGVMWRPSPNYQFGLAYASPIYFHGTGTGNPVLGSKIRNDMTGEETYIEPVDDQYAACAPGGTVGSLSTCVQLDLPQTLLAGGRYILRDEKGVERGDIELDVGWQNWGAVPNVRVIVDGQSAPAPNLYLQESLLRHGYVDTWNVRLGGSYRIDLANLPFVARGGLAYDSAAAPVSWTRVDMDGADRFTFALGAGVKIGRYQIDVGAAYIAIPTRTVEHAEIHAPPTYVNRAQPDPIQPLQGQKNQEYSPMNEGTYESSYVMGMVGVTTQF